MSANSFGSRFVISSFGESHGPGLGVLIDGCPAGVSFDDELLKKELRRRRPGFHEGQSQVVSGRHEEDEVEILSGVFEGRTLGTPLVMLVRNHDARSGDYEKIKTNPRPGHADDVWKNKFHHVDHRGGGRSSGRETVARVMAGSVAQMLMKQASTPTQVRGYASQIGSFKLSTQDREQLSQRSPDDFAARFPGEAHEKVAEMLKKAQAEGESYGGVAEILITQPPKNIGQPVFHKLKADLAQAFMSVGATQGFAIGGESADVSLPGTKFHSGGGTQYGGIRGGISTGEDILLRIFFKPTSSILDVAKKGRHDPCIITRAIPVLEAMTWLVLADHYLWTRTDHI